MVTIIYWDIVRTVKIWLYAISSALGSYFWLVRLFVQYFFFQQPLLSFMSNLNILRGIFFSFKWSMCLESLQRFWFGTVYFTWQFAWPFFSFRPLIFLFLSYFVLILSPQNELFDDDCATHAKMYTHNLYVIKETLLLNSNIRTVIHWLNCQHFIY